MCSKSCCSKSVSQCLFISFNLFLFVSSVTFLILNLFIINTSSNQPLQKQSIWYLTNSEYLILIVVEAFASILIFVCAFGLSIGFFANKKAFKIYACLMGVIFISNLAAYSSIFALYPVNYLTNSKFYCVILPNSLFLTLEALLLMIATVRLLKIHLKEIYQQLMQRNQTQADAISQITTTNPAAPIREILVKKMSQPPQYNGLYPLLEIF